MRCTLKRTLLEISGLLLFACGTAQAQTTVRMEAEDMTLDTYKVEVLDFASNGALINLKGPGYVGNATAPFPGASGNYDITVVYHDENDGLAQLSVSIDGTKVDSWTLDQLIPGGSQAVEANRFSREIATGYAVNNGDEIRINALQGNWDHANVDYIEFVSGGQGGAVGLPIVLDFSEGVPVVLDEPGYYVLDRDWDLHQISEAGLDVVADDVTVDMRGFQIRLDPQYTHNIRIIGNRATLKNGFLRSATVVVSGTDAHLTGLLIDTSDTETGFDVRGEGARIENNKFDSHEQSYPVVVRSTSNVIIRSNHFVGRFFGPTITTFEAEVSSVYILDNVISCGAEDCIDIRGNNNVIAKNTATELYPTFVVVHGNDNQILDNTVLHGLDTPTFAVIDGTRNLIRGNILPSPEDPTDKAYVGISFLQDGNYYGDNLMGAITPFRLNGTIQVDLGGNQGL